MPRGHKSKLRARQKRHQLRADTRGAQEEESPLSSSPPVGESPESVPGVLVSQGPVGAQSTTTAAASGTFTRAAKGQEEGRPSSSGAPPATDSTKSDLISIKAGMLLQYLLEKFKRREPVMKSEMMKVLGRKYKQSFPEIMNITTELLELVFGLVLKEMDTITQSYVLLRKLCLTEDERNLDGDDDREFPRNGLLLALLALIYINGKRVTEEDMWEYLNMLGVYDGEKHVFFGEPRKFLMKDMVQEKYLEYVQVPNSDPPRFEFQWGPRAHAETSKMQALEFYAKVTGAVPTDFPLQYEEALREEEMQAKARVAAKASRATKSRACASASSGSSSNP
ncbi:melanoma-associated antigen B1-like [Echinops telfairi]|uniref:Melanoma-associated antigen B1-like n=1 Tax=Echinops telfairi TaxID=9371 RepID=A0ABM0J3E4_ECHTE|nr:melanoma-associated antigen B1-like [Echinops telfairi]